MSVKVQFWLWLWILYAVIPMGLLSACAPYVEQTVPAIVLAPTGGGPGTVVAVRGSGFPTKIALSVRLGPPSVGATPQSYGDVITDAGGRFEIRFTMPSHWPDGTLITGTDLVVIVLNQDGSAKATAPFGYLPSLSEALPRLPGITEAHGKLILAWHRESHNGDYCSDVVVYDSGYAEVTSCKNAGSLERLKLSQGAVDQLRAWVKAYRSFEVEQVHGTGPSRVLTRIAFVGEGSRQVSELELRVIQTLVETLPPSS